MFENIMNFFKKLNKKEEKVVSNSKEAAKERLHLVLMQDRANVSADCLELMKQEIIDVIKKYIEVDEKAIDVRLTAQVNSDGTNGAPILYANIPIVNMRNEMKKEVEKEKNEKTETNKEKQEKVEEIKQEENKEEKKPEEQKENKEETKEDESQEDKEIKENKKVETEENKEKENEEVKESKEVEVEEDKEEPKEEKKEEVKKGNK